ncbi:hypothetical protein D5R81_17905 [Parashewanella spongiae]|uniref:Uncharacterized protein n=1 Tax=Parashewanella spongiae TaxID=342950 RepID=A0A3A6TAD2_9GAMM|nr:hypothetical protein [Parashewanella spongiae]MCL1079924.1 hypothetical protein [Parashewanella spongiae]RJY06350.1 hypothetical protein D5R81_17905 [Parashewanella spongiae]
MKKVISAIFCQGLPKRDIKNANKVNLWALAWVGSLVIFHYGSKELWFMSPLMIAVAVITNVAIGVGMVLAYRKMLIELDEMEKKIQLDALALSVGTTIITFSGYSILQELTTIPVLEPSHLILVVSATYMIGIVSGRIRYL